MASKSSVSPLLLLGAAMLVRGGKESSREEDEDSEPDEKEEGGKETARGERAPTKGEVTASASGGILNPTRRAGRTGRGGLMVCFFPKAGRVLSAEERVTGRGRPEDGEESPAPPPSPKGKSEVAER